MTTSQSQIHTLSGMKFKKISSPAGDWIVFTDPDLQMTSAQVSALCDRTQGIGAVGVVILRQEDVSTAQLVFSAYGQDGRPPHYETEAARIVGQAAKSSFLPIDQPVQITVVSEQTRQEFAVVLETGFVSVLMQPPILDQKDLVAETGTDSLVLVDGLEDPRQGMSLRNDSMDSVMVMLENRQAVDGIKANAGFRLEPVSQADPVLGLIAVHEPLLVDGTGQLHLKMLGNSDHQLIGSYCQAAVVAVQQWAGLHELGSWQVHTPQGEMLLIADRNASGQWWTAASVSTIFRGEI